MKITNIVLLITIIISTLTSCASQKMESASEKKAALYYNQGTIELNAKEYTSALKNLLQANKFKPNDTKILNNLGMAYFFKNAKKRAIRIVKRSVKVDPKNSDARTNLGSIYLSENQLEHARQQYNIVLKDLTYPKQFRTHYNLGIIALRHKNEKSAINSFLASVEEREEYCSAHYQLGNIYYKKGQFDKALEKYKNATFGTCVNMPEPNYRQALSLIKLEQFSQAKQKLIDIIERHSLTKHEKLARRQLLIIAKLEKKLYLENESRLLTDRKIFTPDF
jgi:type IV pilus assembly protein PilF